jgi:hypothetical protein
LDPSSPASWIEEAELLAAASEKLAKVLPSKEVGLDNLFQRAIQLYSAAARSRSSRIEATQRMALLLLRRSVFFRDLDLIAQEESGHLSCAEAKYRTLMRRSQSCFRKCLAAQERASNSSLGEIKRLYVNETTKAFFKYRLQSSGQPVGVPAFAKAVSQPLLWQNLLVSQHQDGKEVEIWDISSILSQPHEVTDPSILKRVSLRGAASSASSTIRALSIDFDHLFVSDDSNSVRIWSLRAIRHFLAGITEPDVKKTTQSASGSNTSQSSEKVELEYATPSTQFHLLVFNVLAVV